jgi:hypothetical protein
VGSGPLLTGSSTATGSVQVRRFPTVTTGTVTSSATTATTIADLDVFEIEAQ